MKRLYRSRRNQVVGGVCAGLADYFAADVTLFRIIVGVSAFFGGSGILFYLVAWMIVPEEPREPGEVIEVNIPSEKGYDINMRIIGIVAIGVGLVILIRNVFPFLFYRQYFFPAILVLLGIWLISGGLRGQKR